MADNGRFSEPLSFGIVRNGESEIVNLETNEEKE